MAAKRYYYSDKIEDFIIKDPKAIIGQLSLSDPHDLNSVTKNSWLEEITILKDCLSHLSYNSGTIYFEYNIPRMGKRADVILIINNIIFVIEFKTSEQHFTRPSVVQVWDYALDLKNFHEKSRERLLIPILIAPKEKNSNCQLELKYHKDGVYEPLCTNYSNLLYCLQLVINSVIPQRVSCTDESWARSGYEPTPTIIEAAVALFDEHTVEDITKHDGDVETTAICIDRIIHECKENNRKAICFVTGVPGAGKTLIGLETAIGEFHNKDKAVYLSGNFPLVEVLQEALTRDYVRRQKDDYKAGKIDKPISKDKAKSKVKAFIQMVHHYRDLYLEGTCIKDGKIEKIPGYFESHTDKAYIPTEHVAIFDEAQRAWTKEELVRFMKEKKAISDFPYSEPEYLISCMDRQTDWGLVICLIGGGQEINKGEAGISEWIKSLNRSFKHWHVYMSDKLKEKEYADGKALEIIDKSIIVHKEPALHLSVSMRSFRAEKLSLFVHHLLSLNKEEAKATLKELDNYPLVITRSLETAKKWLKDHARGSERMGILASSKAERLKAININVRYQPDFVHWFLEDDTDIRSSNALEDTLTEFKVQGLEIDWACVAWDADLRLNSNHDKWGHYQLRSGTKWQNINKEINREYQINAYRVLLTRARQGMIIVVPSGDIDGVPPDETRNPEWYKCIYEYLHLDLGIPEIV